MQFGLQFGSPGTIDFIQYWSAFKAVMDGGNPYDPEVLRGVQLLVGHDGAVAVLPIMMWTPPWILVVLSPILWAGFSTAALLWICCNIAMVGASGLLVWGLHAQRQMPMYALALSAAWFFPWWEALVWGQISILLLLGIAGTYWAWERGHDAWAGVFLALLTLKPHLFYLVFVFLGWLIIRDGRYRIIWYAGIAWCALAFGVVAMRPSLLLEWLQVIVHRDEGLAAVDVLEWKSANLPTLLRSAAQALTGSVPFWPMVWVPLIATLGLMVWLAKSAQRLSVQRHLVPILALSLFTSPYGWKFDHSALMIGQVLLIGAVVNGRGSPAGRRATVIGLIFVQVVGVAQAFTAYESQFYYLWVPAAMILVWVYATSQGLIDDPCRPACHRA